MTDTNMSNTARANETSYEIVRETKEGGSLLSRFVVDLQTNNVAYYCEVGPEKVDIHRGDISGDVFATTQSFQGKDGLTEIDLIQVEATVPIRHKHHTLPFMHGYSAFRVEGTQYQWKKHRELVNQSSGKHLATFDINSDKASEKLGRLTVLPDAQDMTDLIVVTCLVDHERGDEGKYTTHEEAVVQGDQK